MRKSYRYSADTRLATHIVIPIVLLMLSSCGGLCFFSVEVRDGLFTYLFDLFIITFGLLLGYYLIIGLFFIPMSNIELSEEGIRLDILGPWKIEFPKSSLQDAKIVVRERKEVLLFNNPILNMERYFNPLINLEGYKSYVVQVRGLTVFHTFVGLVHGLGFVPAFVVTSHHEEYEELAERLIQITNE